MNTREAAAKMAEIMGAYAEGKTIQIRVGGTPWLVMDDDGMAGVDISGMISGAYDLRIKPGLRDIWVNEYCDYYDACETRKEAIDASVEVAERSEPGYVKRVAVHYREVIEEK